MVDPILKELRDIRRRLSADIARDPRKAAEETRRRALSIAHDIEWLGPHMFRANYRLPEAGEEKPQG